MHILCTLPVAAALAVLLDVASPRADEPPQQPLLQPARDVDITYDITRPNRPVVRERVRWSASERLQRIDGPGKSTTIYDRNDETITLLNAANRTYRKLEGAPRWPFEPDRDAVLTRGALSVVAGLQCTDWSWTQDVETHSVCVTPDGVLLRFVLEGKTVAQARSVKYRTQRAELFQVPSGYAPALAPEGGAEP